MMLKKICVGMSLFPAYNSDPSAITKSVLFNKRASRNTCISGVLKRVKDVMSVDIQDVVSNSLTSRFSPLFLRLFT